MANFMTELDTYSSNLYSHMNQLIDQCQCPSLYSAMRLYGANLIVEELNHTMDDGRQYVNGELTLDINALRSSLYQYSNMDFASQMLQKRIEGLWQAFNKQKNMICQAKMAGTIRAGKNGIMHLNDQPLLESYYNGMLRYKAYVIRLQHLWEDCFETNLNNKPIVISLMNKDFVKLLWSLKIISKLKKIHRDDSELARVLSKKFDDNITAQIKSIAKYLGNTDGDLDMPCPKCNKYIDNYGIDSLTTFLEQDLF